MAEVNLLKRYPSSNRNIKNRKSHKTKEIIELSKKFGFDYFDGSRDVGYGGYYYDGRWVAIAEDIVEHFGLKPGMKVLDIGCAKGFLVKDLIKVCPGLEAFGVDISQYAIDNCEPEVKDRVQFGRAEALEFEDDSFDVVISINTIHNLIEEQCLIALKEIQRVASQGAYVQVDAYRTDVEKKVFEDWVLTAETYHTPENWEKLFSRAGYAGDYYWTIMS